MRGLDFHHPRVDSRDSPSIMEFVIDPACEEILRATLEASPETGRILEEHADRIIAKAKDNVQNPRIHGQLNPGPYPWRRTGDLQASIQRTNADKLEVLVIADATHGGHLYPKYLREGLTKSGTEYKIATDDDIASLFVAG